MKIRELRKRLKDIEGDMGVDLCYTRNLSLKESNDKIIKSLEQDFDLEETRHQDILANISRLIQDLKDEEDDK